MGGIVGLVMLMVAATMLRAQALGPLTHGEPVVVDDYGKKWASSSTLVPDLNGDGVDDLVLLYSGGPASPTSSQSPPLGTHEVRWVPGRAVADGGGFGQLSRAADRLLFHDKSRLNYPVQVAGGLLNNDTHTDLVVVGFYGDQLLMLTGNGNGVFGSTDLSPVTFSSTDGEDRGQVDGARSVKIADINADGWNDIIVAAEIGKRVMIFFNNPNTPGTFAPPAFLDVDADGAHDIQVIDLDQDGLLDIVCANSFAYTVTYYRQTLPAGTFLTARVILLSGVNEVTSTSWADVNGDGLMDMITSAAGSSVEYYENTGATAATPAFTHRQTVVSFPDANFTLITHFVDIDNDGVQDVLWCALAGTTGWAPGNGAGGFGPVRLIATNATRPFHCHARDVTGDGLPEVFLAAYAGEPTGHLVFTPYIVTASDVPTASPQPTASSEPSPAPSMSRTLPAPASAPPSQSPEPADDKTGGGGGDDSGAIAAPIVIVLALVVVGGGLLYFKRKHDRFPWQPASDKVVPMTSTNITTTPPVAANATGTATGTATAAATGAQATSNDHHPGADVEQPRPSGSPPSPPGDGPAHTGSLPAQPPPPLESALSAVLPPNPDQWQFFR